MKKRIIAMVLSVAMMLTMFPTGVLADDFVNDKENAAGITDIAEGQSNENQGEGESASIVSEEPAPAETEDQTAEPAASESQATEPVESESQATDPAASESQAAEPAASASQATDPAASESQAAEPEEKDNSVNTADLYNPQPTDITAEDNKTTIKVGESVKLKSDAGRWSQYHEWTSDDPGVATVVGSGRTATVTGKKAGTVTITHSYGVFFTEPIEITVLPEVSAASAEIRVEGEESAVTELTLPKYEKRQLKAVINPTDAAYKSCTWSVGDNDSNVLDVNPNTGEITAKGVGSATVTLTVTNYDNSEVKATLPVTVTNPIPTSAVITVTEGNVDDLYPQDTLTLVPGVEPGSADEYDCAWVSSDAEVATVAGGATQATVTAVKAGTAKITLTVTPKSAEAAASADEASPAAEPVKAELAVKVKAVTSAESVTISSDRTEVPVHGEIQFKATVSPVNAQGSYKWKSGNENVLTIDETTGLATGKAEGTTTVTVTFTGKDATNVVTATSQEIKVTAAKTTERASVYYLLDPTKDANSNDSGNWGPSLGTAWVDVAGAVWTSKDNKNCFDNLDTRVISWPDTCPGGVVPKGSTAWNAIFAKWKTKADQDTGRDVQPDDVLEIKLVPAKISRNNGTNPDKHLDCNVQLTCKDIVMVNFKVQGVGQPTAVQVGTAKNYDANSTVSKADVPNVEPTKLYEGKEYAFRGWYLKSDFSGNKITFESDYKLGMDNVTFYGRYVEKHQVAYDLDGGSWADDNTLVYDVYEGDTHTVKADPTREGYRFDGWETTVTIQNGQFTMPDSDVTLTAKWIPTTRSYTVNYYWNGTTTPVHDSTTKTANVGDTIENLEPVSVDGYTPVSDDKKSIIIDEDAAKNVITFYYYKNVTLTANSNENPYIYDGEEKTVTGYRASDDAATFEGIAASGTGTNAGTHEVTFTENPVGKTSTDGKYIVTKAEPGKLTITPKNIVPGDNNKDLTATAPDDVVYSGKSQQQKPIVKDGDKVLEEGKDYTLTYSKDTTNAGTVTVTITGNGNYGSEFKVTYEITPASLKIITNSAEKTYDGSALTADGKIEGVAERDKNDVKLNITGSQTEVGESKNTYTIEWGTAKASNYEITEDIGTLKVNARSGGGSSSKPTPEDEPTPTPTPTPLPTLPTTPAPTTPTRRVTRSTATVTEPASRPTEQITENETPKAESEPEVIEDEETPLAPMAGGAWALVNLILMLLTVLASLLLLLGYLGKKKYAKEDEYGNALHDANGNEIIDYTRNKKGFWRVASLIPAIAAVIAFALTENMRLPMVMTDRWTLLMVIIAVVQLIVAVLCKKKKESEEDENQANA